MTATLLMAILMASCGVKPIQSNAQPITHELWDQLVQKNVTPDGVVNYKGFIADKTKFDQYLDLLRNHHPNNKNWTKDEQLAYWINAYNAFTIQLISDNYPVKSIKELGGAIYKVNTPWDIKFIKIEGQEYDLNNIEHDIIRVQFDEPRIHFAVNCAAKSCPKVSNRAFTADSLEQQLTDAAEYFLRDVTKNQLTPNSIQLSKIFSWYRFDFKKGNRTVIDFINEYSPVKVNKDAEVSYLDYSWALNE